MIITPPSVGGGASKFTTMVAEASVGFVSGAMVYADNTGKWAAARANGATATRTYGYIIKDVSAGFAGLAINAGQLELSTAQWDTVIEGVGVGGLSPGSQYFLSEAVAGQITDTPLTTGFRVPVGKAITDQRMAVQVDECIQL